MPKQTALVTGATGAIGQAIAHQMADTQTHKVVLLCRNEKKAQQTVAEIKHHTKNNDVSYELVDLASKAAIETFANRWADPVHVLINNAAIAPRRREETAEGIELQFATNVLGYLWLTLALTPHLKKAAPARVVNVASYWAGDLDLEDLQFKRRPYNNNTAYRQSKQANRMLTVALANRLKADNITVNACHPGDVNSTLSNSLGFGGHQTGMQGAKTPVWLATDPIGQQVTGKYFEHLCPVKCRFGENETDVEILYQECLCF